MKNRTLAELKSVVIASLRNQLNGKGDDWNHQIAEQIDAVKRSRTWAQLESLADARTGAAVANRCLPSEL